MPDPILGTSCCAIGAPAGQPITDVVVNISISGGLPFAETTGRLVFTNAIITPLTPRPDTWVDVPVVLDENGEASINVNIPPPVPGNKRCKARFEIAATALNGALGEEFFVDSGITYDGEPATVIEGLDHLEGETVHILADGVVVSPQVVVDGAITLSSAASIVHAGLPYEHVLQPMRMDADPNLGNTMAQVKRIHKLVVRVIDTGASSLRIGVEADGPSVAVPLSVENPSDLFNGDRVWELSADSTRDATFVIRGDSPQPLTVIAVTNFYQVSDNS